MKSRQVFYYIFFPCDSFSIAWFTLFHPKNPPFDRDTSPFGLFPLKCILNSLQFLENSVKALSMSLVKLLKSTNLTKKILKLNKRRLGILASTLSLLRSKTIILFEAKLMTKQVTYVQRLERRPLYSKQRLKTFSSDVVLAYL